MKITTIKRILIISLAINIIFVFFSFYQYKIKDSIKRDIILEYTSNLSNIRDSLNSALKDRENQENLINWLTQAKGFIIENINFLGNGTNLGKQTGLAEIEMAYYFNRGESNAVNRAILSASKGALTEEDIRDIEAHIAVLDTYIKELNINYSTVNKESSKSLIDRIRKAVDKVKGEFPWSL